MNIRRDHLNRLLHCLQYQITPEFDKRVQVVVEGDDGQLSIGKKRNLLLEKAVGEYSAFVDDDDLVSDDYINEIFKATESAPDCVGMEGIFSVPQKQYSAIFKHSIEYQGWYTGPDAYYRTPNHLNPIKTDLAKKIGFPEVYNGEDRIFSETIHRLLKTEVYIDHPIYFYEKVFQNANTVD